MYINYVKRLFDIIISLLASPAFFYFCVVLAFIVYLDDRGPIFFISDRRGKEGKTFKMYKFRSMRRDAPVLKNQDGSTYSGENDPRVTQIGKIIRKTSVDELPQIINVLKGDMSIIGPRPTLTSKNYADLDNLRKKRLFVRPGITGYSQAYYRNSISQDKKLINDCYYVDNISFKLDTIIFMKTVISVIFRNNVNFQESFQN